SVMNIMDAPLVPHASIGSQKKSSRPDVGNPSSPPAERISAKSICATKLRGHGRARWSLKTVLFGRAALQGQGTSAGDRACRRGGSPLSERLRPLRQDQVRGSWRVARRLPIEETTLRAQPERARLPTLCALSTSATSFCGRCAHHAEFLAPNGGSHSAEGPLLALLPRSLRSGDAVRVLRNFCRADEATAMPLHDPYLPCTVPQECAAVRMPIET